MCDGGVPTTQGDVWMCMELMDFSLEAVKNRVYRVLKERIPEEVIGKICVAVSGGEGTAWYWACVRHCPSPCPTPTGDQCTAGPASGLQSYASRFALPRQTARHIHTPPLTMLLWMLGGGASCYIRCSGGFGCSGLSLLACPTASAPLGPA